VLSLGIASGSGSVGPGSYPIEQQQQPASGAYSNAQYATFDDACRPSETVQATSGSVIVQTASASLVTGSFDLTMSTGDHVAGTFSAPVCDAPVASDAGPPACGS
jgi:hypothetical protein